MTGVLVLYVLIGIVSLIAIAVMAYWWDYWINKTPKQRFEERTAERNDPWGDWW